jgi:DNA-binding transcriptional ArsR family regulator
MKDERGVYHPTVWRTCRALMNERRLACLAVVLRAPGLSVGKIAVESRMPENQASINLRALQARGLIAARRDGVHIRYFAEPDPLVDHAAELLGAVRLELRRAGGRRAALATLRAFTHARRLTILRHLALRGGATVETLVAKTRISQPAVWRHLTTLLGAGLVCATEQARWQVMPGKRLSGLAKTLLNVIIRG